MEQEFNIIDEVQEQEVISMTKINQPKLALAMAYVPPQEWVEIYDSDIGFVRGTIFQQLDKPFIGEEAVSNDRA